MEETKRVLIVSDDPNLNEVLYFCLDGWGYEVLIEDNVPLDIQTVKKTSPDIIIIDVHSARRNDLKICKSLKEDFTTASIPVIILIEKRQLRMHLLSLRQGVDDYLIKPPDPLDLRVRIEMALRRTHYSFYTNALTGLSGARFIEEILKDKLKKNEIFSFAHVDIDHFKYFNDRYGYIRGDRVIMQTAHILYAVVKNFGREGDFVGHIGGDDFVFITVPQKEEVISREFIYEFIRLIPLHYSPEDRRQGYILARLRTGVQRKVPLMSVSISIVNNLYRKFDNIIQINEAVASIKEYLKKIPGSKYMVDRRRGKDRVHKSSHSLQDWPRIIKPQEKSFLSRPLGQILLEKGLISPQQLEEALDIHWRRGLRLGEVLRDMGWVDTGVLEEALKYQSTIRV